MIQMAQPGKIETFPPPALWIRRARNGWILTERDNGVYETVFAYQPTLTVGPGSQEMELGRMLNEVLARLGVTWCIATIQPKLSLPKPE